MTIGRNGSIGQNINMNVPVNLDQRSGRLVISWLDPADVKMLY